MRSLKLGKLSSSHLSKDDFLEFGTNLEELHVNYAGLQSVKNNAFQYVQSLKRLDLSENSIGTIDNDAFVDASFTFSAFLSVIS